MQDDIIPFVLAAHQNGQCETLDQAKALLRSLSVRPMRNVNLFVMDMRSNDPLGFGMLETKQNVDLRGGVARLGDYPDRRWVEQDVIPHYLRVKEENQASVRQMRSRIQDVVAVFDRVVVPVLRTGAGTPDWAFSLTRTRFVLPVDGTALSTREDDVLDLLISGHSAKEIAMLLDLSFRTVEHHISAIKTKLAAKNVAHATAIGTARKLGLSE
ncbi:hypothetical protein Sa4125_15330 [Aureimonas sp. SA4125]|uniref:helix-turn-helix domain-containing protein n=1 Tax=Aureimonas sp. SA4125 TaxID=2826993 RepID=UPI001CC4255E|nr:helix-turn-helix transcriptional regulator [Aureimonas sp. SA4125]BDA83991.1 hypothetical protein Sa4125_15330 [Aureimonas sp. SA4125]